MKTFKMKSPYAETQGEGPVQIPTEIDSFEISKDPKGEILIQSPEHSDLKIHYINPSEWNFHGGRHSRGDLFLMEFGWQSYTPSTFVLLWEGSFQDALEESAAYMKDHFPGVFVEFDEGDIKDARKDLAEEKGVEPSEISDNDAYEAATVDHMYTESGYLASDQWGGHKADHKLKEVALQIGKLLAPEDE